MTDTYKKELERFCERKLSHLKKPTFRKRKLVKTMAFAIGSFHKRNGAKTQK